MTWRRGRGLRTIIGEVHSTDGAAHTDTDDTMAKKKTDKTAEGDEPKKKKNPVVIGGLCLLLAGVGYMMGGRKAGAQDGSAPTTTIEQLEGCKEGTDAATVEHHAIDLPSMSVNLADSHYLKVTVSLALCPDVVLAEGAEFVSAPAKDIIVSTLSGNSMTVLADEAGREQAKKLLSEQIAKAYPDIVYEIYFTEFVMQ
ncbi:MAG: flagellar basal body-associated protein FliL [Ilumatobacteraceae bacterium]|nr:flagellar basal body-associated protein FliL [Ilumatobacteraceae bacterium]